MRPVRCLLMLLVSMGLATMLHAQVGEPVDAALSAEQQTRYHRLTNELRCLVCQNQSIAESNAPLANDLKDRVRQQIREGRSDEAIRNYMRERYGDFVLYKPPFNAVTAALWISPLLLLGIGALWLALRMRRAGADDLPEADDEDENSLR